MAQQHSDDFDGIDETEKILTQARFQFSLKCLEIVMDLNENKNFVFSPYSIYEGLLLVYLASSDDTELHLRSKLKLPDHILQKDITDCILHSITEKKKKDKKLCNYNDKNSCWITHTKRVNNMAQCLFHEELKVVNFHQDSINLKNWINKFLRKKTRDYICTPVELNKIDKNMEIILSNVLCLKGDTVTYVPADAYKPQSWKKPRTTISSKLKMFISELPFADKNSSLILLFPAKKSPKWKVDGNILELVERLTTREGIDELRRLLLDNQESPTKILREEMLLYPDLFKLENELNINDLLDELGIKSFLEPDKGTLSKFTDENLHLGGAKHRAYIKVTQKNVTAGAVNIFFTKEEGSFKPTADINNFICRGKKFLWLLYCRESHTILFIGSVNEEVPLPSPTGCFERIRRMFR